jgi:hypothetical protein
MKTIGQGILLGLLALIGQGCGSGDKQRPRNDPGYSTHNYKQPNKADSARKWERKAGVLVKTPGMGDDKLSNYKRPSSTKVPRGGITVEHTTSPTDVIRWV